MIFISCSKAFVQSTTLPQSCRLKLFSYKIARGLPVGIHQPHTSNIRHLPLLQSHPRAIVGDTVCIDTSDVTFFEGSRVAIRIVFRVLKDSGLGWLAQRILGGVPREQRMLQGHLPRVIYHQFYQCAKISSLT